MAPALDVQAIRQQFPALGHKQIYFDNAGGSQVLKSVVDSISDYLLSNNVQLGASYPISQASTKLFDDGCKAVATYVNAAPEEVVLGPSTTQLFRNLSLSLYDYIQPGDEIVVSKLDHEANIASWVTLAKWKGAKLIWWDSPHSQTNPTLEPSHLRTLMSEKTRLVTCTHTSNILGTISPIRDIAEVVHSFPGALLCVDAVAYAPHAPVDVKALGVDFYCFSWYKVFGPHIASMYASSAAQKHLTTLGHFFKPTHTLENLLGLAAANYELVASIPKVCAYIERVSWRQIEAQEEKLQAILIEYLLSKTETYQIYGVPVSDRRLRHPTISFTVKGKKSREVVETIEERSAYGCRWGSFYSNRLAKEVMGIDDVDGVVRVSLLHYNTEEEVRGFVEVLDGVVFGGR
ncbi:Aminotransferase class-V [Teratosphaeria destructans]|uniref:Aminotransferase class-V n=1 Tax=Teratosphaeria destructans TaxID=418781 RepID=A0A9W7SJV0_9PEZI|nr:Aminotransferase class-V [Teratosphaeria destructans]